VKFLRLIRSWWRGHKGIAINYGYRNQIERSLDKADPGYLVGRK